MTTIDTNILLIIAAGVLALAVILWLLLRGRGGDTAAPPEQPAERAPLTPNKPQIDLAQPVRFDVPPPDRVPVTAAPPVPVAPAMGEPDDLRRIKGLGPKLATLLASLGVTRFDQIAAWTEADIAAMDAHLGTFAGRITRDNWVEQARFLAAGDEAGFAQRFGALGG